MEPARVAVCASNLRSQHTSIHMIALDRPYAHLPSSDALHLPLGILPDPNGYRGDQFGMANDQLIEYGYTDEVGFCPRLTPDTGGGQRRSFYYGFGNPVGMNGNDYIYTGGAANGEVDAPGFGFRYPKRGGLYVSLDVIIAHPAANSGAEPTELPPSQVIYITDTTYNTRASYPGWYYTVYVDPSNHADDRKKRVGGISIWPAQGRGSNRVHADGSVKWFQLDDKFKLRGDHPLLPPDKKSYARDAFAAYW